MIKGSVNYIETSGFVDGPGIRTVVFLNYCNKRCLYCHNPEMFLMGELNYTPLELVNRILRNKPYFGSTGGVTFSGGEPLLQLDFLIECCKLLKSHNIHVCIDTSGLKTDFKDLFDYVDLLLLDIKHTNKDDFYKLTGTNIEDFEYFVGFINNESIPIWIRQVIIPDYNDNIKYIKSLSQYIKKINNIARIDFLPFHNDAKQKYEKLNLNYSFKDKNNMDAEECKLLYNELKKLL